MKQLEVWTCQRAEKLKKSSKIPKSNYAVTMVSAARRQIIGGGGGGAPTNKKRRARRPQIVGGGAAGARLYCQCDQMHRYTAEVRGDRYIPLGLDPIRSV